MAWFHTCKHTQPVGLGVIRPRVPLIPELFLSTFTIPPVDTLVRVAHPEHQPKINSLES